MGDARSVTRGEVLALRLARQAGIEAAVARIVEVDHVPIAVIEHFDRALAGRIPVPVRWRRCFRASREEDRPAREIADAIRAAAQEPRADLQQLWRRMVFNLLITNVDDHLQNHGFLHVGNGHWRLAPAFDVNPFPDKDRESKTWLSEEHGPIVDVSGLLAHCRQFALNSAEAKEVLSEVYKAVVGWRLVAASAGVGLKPAELADFAPAFEHDQIAEARAAL